MRLIDRYVLRELALPFCIGITIGVMLLIGTMLFNYMDTIIDRRVPLLLVLKLLVFRAPSFAVIAMPMAMAFAAALAVNRLARDSEITPVRMAGVPFRRVAAPILVAGLVGSIFSYLMAEVAAPRANQRAWRVIRQMWMMQVAPTAQPNVFLQAENYTFYIGWLDRVDKDHFRLKNVLVYDTSRHGAFPVWYTAQEAITTRKRWTLKEVCRRDIGRDGMTVHETLLPELVLDLEKDVDFVAGAKSAEEMTGDELLRQIRSLRSTGAGNLARSYEVDYHFRFALPLACLVFGLIGAPISFRFSRGGTFVGVLVSILIGFLYWNVMILFKGLGAHGVLPPVVAAWTQDAVFGGVAAYLLWRAG